MRQVYTYRTLAGLNLHPRFAEFSRYPQITATHDLLLAIRSKYRTQIRLLEDIYNLQEILFPDWGSPSTSLQQFMNLSRIIRQLPVTQSEANLKKSFSKNKSDVLKAVRALVEAGVYPEDLHPVNPEELMFSRIWINLENEDSSFGDFRVELGAFENNPALFKAHLELHFPILKCDTIVLHGFFYINPLQERLIDCMESCGKRMIFLCCIDDSVPEAEAIWYKALTEANRFAPRCQWVSDDFYPVQNQSFGSVFTSNPIICPNPHITITEYKSQIDFIQDIGTILKRNEAIYSTSNKEAEAMLRNFYPELYQRRHLLSYPVGQYIYQLHSMWKADSQQLELSIDNIQSCFSSGWVVCDGINAINYTDKLDRLKTYVSDCRTLSEWKSRMILLQEIKQDVLQPFEAHIQQMPSEHQSQHRIMSDPFLNLSCFSLSEEDLQNLTKLILHLIKTAESLFSSPGEISVDQHFKKIRDIIVHNVGRDELYEEENIILDELCSRLKNPNLQVQKCLPNEISEAVMMIAGGGILDDDNDEWLFSKSESRIKPMAQMEAASILYDGRIHLCLADENRLPFSQPPLPWPLNCAMLRRTAESFNSRRRQYLEDLCFIVENQPLASRYLFFSLLQNSDVEISWISTENEKNIAASPYVQILHRLFSVPCASYESNRSCSDEVSKIEPARSPLSLQFNTAQESSMEQNLDISLCPWRYIYGYCLSEFPSYSTDFHYNFALSTLIGAISNVTGFSKKKAAKEILSLFPYLREVEKQQITDYIPYYRDSETDAMDGVSYPTVRLHPHFLTSRILNNAQNNYENLLQSGSKSLSLVDAGSYTLCMFCPWNADCPHSCHDSQEDN